MRVGPLGELNTVREEFWKTMMNGWNVGTVPTTNCAGQGRPFRKRIARTTRSGPPAQAHWVQGDEA